MNPNEILPAVRTALAENTARLCDLLRAQPDLTALAGNGSAWTVRDAAAHLVVAANVHSELAAGTPSPLTAANIGNLAAISAALIADIPEREPDKLAALVADSVDSFLATTADRPGGSALRWHLDIPATLAEFTGVVLNEVLLHGYDIACGLSAPWPIAPDHAALAIGTAVPALPLIVGPAAGHTARYGLELRGGPALTMRFTDGAVAVEPPGGPVDCTVDVDPVALLLLITGRMDRWTAIATGLLSGGGARPDLAAGFPALFAYP